MYALEEAMARRLAARAADNHLRRLTPRPAGLVDFSSNDYLGLARRNDLWGDPMGFGSGGSRLLAGNHPAHEALETDVARFHHAEAALLFNAGYDANLGLMATLAGRHDTIIYDERIHASIREGVRLTPARSFAFRHNDLDALRAKLKQAAGHVLIVVESLYSMDGDAAPLAELAGLCQSDGLHLIVDEAHAVGVLGPEGRGLCMGIPTFARVVTFSKAVGGMGAAVLGSATLKDYLINFCRAFIYSTALPPAVAEAIRHAYAILPELEAERKHVRLLAAQLIEGLSAQRIPFTGAAGPIVGILTPGNRQARVAAYRLQQAGYDVRAVLSPTVPAGAERLRISLHSYNTPVEIEGLLASLS